MKKRWLTILSVFVITFATLAIGVTPVQANKATSFTASGVAFLAGIPGMEPKGVGRHWKVLDEPVAGYILASSWADFTGAEFFTLHDSQVTFLPNGTFTGELKGTFSVTNLSGDIARGTIKGSFKGNYVASPIGPLIATVSDNGSWKFDSGTGVFAGITGGGKWSAELGFDGITLSGPLMFTGSYRQ